MTDQNLVGINTASDQCDLPLDNTTPTAMLLAPKSDGIQPSSGDSTTVNLKVINSLIGSLEKENAKAISEGFGILFDQDEIKFLKNYIDSSMTLEQRLNKLEVSRIKEPIFSIK